MDDLNSILNYSSLNETDENGTEAAATSSSSSTLFCGTTFKSFEQSYRQIHGYTSIIVCVVGAFANLLNLVVLTRKGMLNSTNRILIGIALADMLNMVEYIPYVTFVNFYDCKSYSCAVFVYVHSFVSQTCHTTSIWLTVTLAAWRYAMATHPQNYRTLCSMEQAKLAVGLVYIISPILCIPILFLFSITRSTSSSIQPFIDATKITETRGQGQNNVDRYVVNLSVLTRKYPVLLKANFWFYSVMLKLIPCLLLTVVSHRLIKSLIATKEKKKSLKRGFQQDLNKRPMFSTERCRSCTELDACVPDRTTKMLLAVSLLFLITEFPQGILALLSGLLGDAFFKSCYIPFADLMDFIALLNAGINFVLYCTMSRKFRLTFSQVFHLNFCGKPCADVERSEDEYEYMQGQHRMSNNLAFVGNFLENHHGVVAGISR